MSLIIFAIWDFNGNRKRRKNEIENVRKMKSEMFSSGNNLKRFCPIIRSSYQSLFLTRLNPKIITIIPAITQAIVKPEELFSSNKYSADFSASLPNELALILFKTFTSGSGTEPSITFCF